MDFVKHFDLVFGAIFGVIGMVGLIAGAVMCVVFTRRPPKERVTWLFVCLPLGIGILFTLIGGVWGGGALDRIQLEERLRTSGVSVRATVVDVERTGSRLNGRYLWQVRYEYQDATGRYHEGVSGYLERIDAQRYHAGERVFVRYDPAQPSASIWLGREDVARDQDTHQNVAFVAISVSERCIWHHLVCYRPVGAPSPAARPSYRPSQSHPSQGANGIVQR